MKILALTIIKVCFHKEDYENALNYILLAPDHFDIKNRDEFVDKMISRAIDRYSAIQKHNYSAGEGDKIIIDANLTNLINNIFDQSFATKNDHKIIAGLAVEARRLDVVQRVINGSSNLSDILGHLFDISQNHVQSKLFKDALIKVILEAYASTGKDGLDAWNVCQCYLHLGNAEQTAKVIIDLVNKGTDRSTLLALQISSDIQEAENQAFTDNLLSALDSESLTSTDASAAKEQIIKVLNGQFRSKNSYKFLSQNNRANKANIDTMRKFWNKKNSSIHNAIINSFALMHAGTLDDTYLESDENKEFSAKNNNWAKFLSIACLGTIHKSNPDLEQKLRPFHPGASAHNEFVHGGSLYAYGLALASTAAPSKLQSTSDFLQGFLQSHSTSEPICHGAQLSLGLLHQSSQNQTYIDILKPFLHGESAPIGESAAYSIGMISTGSLNLDLM